jgi:hypothetical protein
MGVGNGVPILGGSGDVTVGGLPHGRDLVQRDNLRRPLVLYRMVFGQNRQEDIVNDLLERLPAEEAEKIMALCRVDLSPPRAVGGADAPAPPAARSSTT